MVGGLIAGHVPLNGSQGSSALANLWFPPGEDLLRKENQMHTSQLDEYWMPTGSHIGCVILSHSQVWLRPNWKAEIGVVIHLKRGFEASVKQTGVCQVRPLFEACIVTKKNHVIDDKRGLGLCKMMLYVTYDAQA